MSNPSSYDVEFPDDLESLDAARIFIQHRAFERFRSFLKDATANVILCHFADQQHQMSSEGGSLFFWRYYARLQNMGHHAIRHYQHTLIPKFFDLMRLYATSRRDPAVSARLKADRLVSIAKRSLVGSSSTPKAAKPASASLSEACQDLGISIGPASSKWCCQVKAHINLCTQAAFSPGGDQGSKP